MTTFLNARLPTNIETGARGGLGFKTTVLASNDGTEQRNIEWERARGRWDISYGIQDKADLLAVKDHHHVCHGKALGFRFRDYSDYIMPRQTIAIGDASTTQFQVYREYEVIDLAGVSFIYRHYLTRIVVGTFSLWLDGVLQGSSDSYGLDVDTGVITFNGAAPGLGVIIEFECWFDRPVRFDIDQLDVQAILEANDAEETPDEEEGLEGITSIPIIELKERLVTED